MSTGEMIAGGGVFILGIAGLASLFFTGTNEGVLPDLDQPAPRGSHWRTKHGKTFLQKNPCKHKKRKPRTTASFYSLLDVSRMTGLSFSTLARMRLKPESNAYLTGGPMFLYEGAHPVYPRKEFDLWFESATATKVKKG